MEIHENDRRFLLEPFKFTVGNLKRTFQIFHIHPSFKIEYTDLDSARSGQNGTPGSRRPARIVGGTDNARISQDQRNLFLLVPDMVAAGQQMNALLEQLFGNFDRQAETTGGIFTVGDHNIDRVPVHQAVQLARQRLTTRLADNISDK